MKTINTIAVLALAFAAPVFANDTLTQSGVGNSAIQNSNNNNGVINAGTGAGGSIHNTAFGGHSSSTAVSEQSQYQNATATNKGNKQTVAVAGDAAQKRNPVATAFAAPLAVGGESCMGSSSAGGQGVGFGLSLGTTWHDDSCERRKDAAQLHNMGQGKAALALMCQNESVAAAMQTAGTPCPGKVERVAVLTTASKRISVVENKTDGLTDYPSQPGSPFRH